MSYKYRGTATIAAELATLDTAKQQARQELKERRTLLEKLRRDRRELEALEADREHLDTEIRHLSAVVTTLPAPRYGGEAGLIAAAAESARYDARKRAA